MSNVAIVQDGYNKEDPWSTVKLVTKPIPKPAPGQVVVHITLRPFNPTDGMSIRIGRCINGTPGSEGFGIVHEVGEGVTTLQEGQRVIPFTMFDSLKGNGSFQKYVCLDAEFVWPVPEEISDEVAAQFVVNPWTTYSMLKEVQVPKGEYIVQSAAGSTLGKQVISLAHHWGIKTINIVRRKEQKAELKALGADEVLCEEDVVARVKEITGGRGAWGALDAVAGTMTATLAASVRDGGQVFLYGALGGSSVMQNTSDLFRGVTIVPYVLYRKGLEDREKRTALVAEVATLMRDGIIPVAKVDKYELTDFKHAVAMAQQPGRSGKVLLVSA